MAEEAGITLITALNGRHEDTISSKAGSSTKVTADGNKNRSFTPVPSARPANPKLALKVQRRFTVAGEDPFDTVEWETRIAAISGEDGRLVFEQKDCDIPKNWSQLATNVVVSKYFRGALGSPERETSVRQVIGRVADTL
ncbi:MAG: hypothetical protein ABI210_14455, partial [Abditibacteriaceae bacterium]